MKVRIKVYDLGGEIFDRLDLTIDDDVNMEQAVSDISDFLEEQYFEIKELEEGVE
jgi:hypothetical protein